MRYLDSMPIGGYTVRLFNVAADGAAIAAALVGATVTMMLNNGTVITGVTLRQPRIHQGRRELTYRLPSLSTDSVVPVPSVTFLFLHHPADALRDPDRPSPITIYVGETRPEVRD